MVTRETNPENTPDDEATVEGVADYSADLEEEKSPSPPRPPRIRKEIDPDDL